MKNYTKEEIMKLLKSRIVKKGDQSQFAFDHGFSPTFIGDVLKGKRPLSDRLIEALGFKILYVRQSGEVKKLCKEKH